MSTYNARLRRRRAATIGEALHGITHGPRVFLHLRTCGLR